MQNKNEQIVPQDTPESVPEVFCIGSCHVEKTLRMEDISKSYPPGSEVVIGLLTKSTRTPAESCSICYYDSDQSARDNDDADADLEKEITQPTVVPVGRYAKLCVCRDIEPDAEGESELDVLAIPEAICSHTFHTNCIYKWVKTSNGGFNCPVCRGGLEKQKISGIPELYVTAAEPESLEELVPEPPRAIYVVQTWPNGRVRSEHFELNGVRDGICKTYTNMGQIESECTYINGSLNGTEKWFYPSTGALKSSSEYSNDQKHGMTRRYATDGRIIGESHWNNGVRHGSNIEWYTDSPDGNPKMCNMEHHLNGEKHGVFMKWAFSGKLTMYGVYRNGQRHGRFAAWFESTGGLRLKEFYLDGVRDGRAVEHYDLPSGTSVKNGPIKEIAWYDHNLKIGDSETFWSNGQLKIHSEYDDAGRESGIRREYNRFGRLCKIMYYDAGQLDGVCHTFDPDTGNPVETSTYKLGQLHGLYVKRYKCGAPKLVRLFKNGIEIMTRSYTRQGTIVWEKLPDGTVKKQSSDDGTIHVRKPRHLQEKHTARFLR